MRERGEEDPMAVVTKDLECLTRGNGDTLDVTPMAEAAVKESKLRRGVLTLFIAGSTAALTTIEFEPGAVADFQRTFEDLAPADAEYQHHLRWGDDNGHAHVRAALLGPSLSVPFVDGKLTLGTWQQIVLCDFDTRPRGRQIVAQIVGE
jgi:secondary thiamine-phosphate synthase enzyme